MNFEPEAANNFIEEIVARDLESGKHKKIVTRFPPEPNGYLHIGHAKAFLLDFGIAEKYHGQCNLRFDDTNPVKEDAEYVDAIKRDIRMAGLRMGAMELHYASDYFDFSCTPMPQSARSKKGSPMWTTTRRSRCAQSRGTPYGAGEGTARTAETPPEENLRPVPRA